MHALGAGVDLRGSLMATAIATVPRHIHVSDDDSYMLIGDVMEHFRASRMWVTRRLADPVLPFPRPTKFGGATSARRWKRRDVVAWEIARAKMSEAA
jgi:predicted DNA-binding transcriptional regulator AlpA